MVLPAQPPMVKRPACPVTLGWDIPGTAAKPTLHGCSSRWANALRPEPNTRARAGGRCRARLAKLENASIRDRKSVCKCCSSRQLTFRGPGLRSPEPVDIVLQHFLIL